MTGAQAHMFAKVDVFSEFGDRDGYAGFVPGHKYFGRFYDKMIERAAPEMKQLIALCSVRVLQGDHSFKVGHLLA